MSSVQTGQLISLLLNNVLMVFIVIAVMLATWLRWHWLQVSVVGKATRLGRRRCRWAYVSFVLTTVTLLGLLASLGVLALRALITLNALVMGAMGLFLLSVITLLLALGIWFVDLCLGYSMLPAPRRTRSRPLLPAMAAEINPHRRQLERRQQRCNVSKV
ncbi:MAG: hypothetical protein AAF572_14545 [Cyanobacteria bacterium P01_B01_bin.77]